MVKMKDLILRRNPVPGVVLVLAKSLVREREDALAPKNVRDHALVPRKDPNVLDQERKGREQGPERGGGAEADPETRGGQGQEITNTRRASMVGRVERGKRRKARRRSPGTTTRRR